MGVSLNGELFMTLARILTYLKGAITKDLFDISNDLNEYLTKVAERAEFSAWMLFAVGLALVFVVGLFAYKLIKPLSAILGCYAGYFIGAEIFYVLLKNRFESCPEWVAYVLGGVIAVCFLLLGFFKFSYVLFAVGALSGYFAIHFYIDSQMLAIGGAFLAGMLMITLIRTSVIFLSSFGCCIFTVSFLSGMLPNVEAFQLELDNWTSLALAVLMFFIYATFQFVTNRRRKEYIE